MDVASEAEKWTHSRNSLNLDSFSWPAGGESSWYKTNSTALNFSRYFPAWVNVNANANVRHSWHKR